MLSLIPGDMINTKYRICDSSEIRKDNPSSFRDEPEKRSWMAAFGRVMAGGGQATTTAAPQRLG